MSKYFSTDTIMAAFSLLNKELSTGTHFSALQYLFALDNYVHDRGCDCDTNTDEDEFISFAHKVAGLEDGEAPDHIDGFSGKRPRKNKDSARIHSNFISAGAVKNSVRATREDPELYPSGEKNCLFAISEKVLLANSIRYDHLDIYLPSKQTKTAFAVWVERNSSFEDGQSFEDGLKSALSQSYTADLIAALWSDGIPSPSDLDLIDNVFSNEKPRISWSVIRSYFPMEKSKNDRPKLPEANQTEQHKKPSGSTAGLPHNWIFFGAPGTGKSHQLNELARKTFSEKNIRRVTLYPDYTYSQFVGGYKPSPLYDKNGRPTSEITYRFIPGPFMLSYIQAVQNPTEPYLLIIEEINRANPAAVFGDVFQLLDRNEKGRSVYEITVPREMEDYLRIHLPEYATTAHIPDPEQLLAEQTRLDEETTRLSLPPNMYIWATMNSADQGVYPMDTAFKRRWDFKYIGINDGANAVIDGVALNEIEVPCGTQTVKWNDLRVAINNFLLTDSIHVNEDKLLGPFFIAPASLAPEKFTQVFENKVLMYLYEDAGKSKRSRLFRSDLKTYSQICDAFETEGAAIFGDGFAAPKRCTEKQADTDDADSSEE